MPEQLDFCDEIGLMVYEECYAAWLLGDSPKMGERFDRNTSDMVRRDRNHPSVAIWGLLNETNEGPVFRQALAFLPKLRALDPTRLVLLNSGRWDHQAQIGSVSNPGSGAWEHVWGIESADTPRVITGPDHPSRIGDGDFHFYPLVPQSPPDAALIRSLGQGSKPVFLSEYGDGSLFNVIHEWLHFQQAGARPDLEDAGWVKRQSEALAADWKRLGFDDVYPFPEDLLRESERLHARQRAMGLDRIRSNPQLCGYNLTGMLDHGMTGEGLWTLWREWKPATFDALRDGWSPLRWCLFVNPLHGYAGRDITIEAVLANEEVLKPGDYPARFRVLGPAGLAWEKAAIVKVPASNPLAVPAIRETIRIDGPPGEYVFAAALERGGAPAGGRLAFHVAGKTAGQLTGSALAWGLDAKPHEWLAARGLKIKPYEPDAAQGASLVLIGASPTPDDAKAWTELKRRMSAGATVLFLSPRPFMGQKAAIDWLPLKNKGRCYAFHDWLYHKECVARRHPVFAGLQAPGIMDIDYYGPVIPHELFDGIDTPDDTIAAAFATGHNDVPGSYAAGVLIGAWRSGKGRFILSTPNILDNLNAHPAADRLLLNLVRYGQGATMW